MNQLRCTDKNHSKCFRTGRFPSLLVILPEKLPWSNMPRKDTDMEMIWTKSWKTLFFWFSLFFKLLNLRKMDPCKVGNSGLI